MKRLALCFILCSIVTLAHGQDTDFKELLYNISIVEEHNIGDSTSFRLFKSERYIYIENSANRFDNTPFCEIDGDVIDSDKEYDTGNLSWDDFERAIKESFSTKERYHLGENRNQVTIFYTFDGENGNLLELSFLFDTTPAILNIPIEKIALFEHNLKKYWQMKFTKPAEYRMKYISDACIYFFPKVLYVENGPRIKEEGLKEFVPI